MTAQKLIDSKFLSLAECILLRLEKDLPVLNNGLLALELRKVYDEGFQLGFSAGKTIFDANTALSIAQDYKLTLPELIEENQKELDEHFDICEKCNELAWDGQICQRCGYKKL